MQYLTMSKFFGARKKTGFLYNETETLIKKKKKK